MSLSHERRLSAAIRRLPFTLVMLALVILVAWVTNTHTDPLASRWVNRLGFAPTDLWYGRLERLFTSALVTSGGKVFWEALFFIALAVGLAEWMTGSRLTLATFWGVHLFVLILLSLVVLLAASQLRNFGLGSMEWERDVGSSVGYFACLGLVSSQLKRPWQWISGAILLLFFITAFFLPAGTIESISLKYSADLAHLMGVSLGWLIGFIWTRRRTRQGVNP
jgi:hypothetical protein